MGVYHQTIEDYEADIDYYNETMRLEHNGYIQRKFKNTDKVKTGIYYYHSDDVYRFITERQQLQDDLQIDYLYNKYTKKQIVDEIEEFGIQNETKDIYNMFFKKKVTHISQGLKRGIIFSSYWFDKWKECCESPYCDPKDYEGFDEDEEYERWIASKW